jgi:peptidoglycan/xylan/chitin deacetylase (PgdA/CDA1 family)
VDVSSRNAGTVSGIVPVILFHSVADEPTVDRRFSVSRPAFEAHADAIAASSRTTLPISELASALRGQRALPERSAAITFDDGFADNYDAVHSLLRRSLCATLYITTGTIGAPGRLDRARVAELARLSGIEIGAHCVTHPYLDELRTSEVVEEVRGCKTALEDLIERDVRSFAYPHGAYDRRVRQAVIDAGYRSAAAVKNAVSHATDDPFAIARWTVTRDTPASRVAQVLEGEDVPRAWAAERLRTHAYRTARRGRRRVARALWATR